jgi:tetratricopeptide (TPR) repeat protein
MIKDAEHIALSMSKAGTLNDASVKFLHAHDLDQAEQAINEALALLMDIPNTTLVKSLNSCLLGNLANVYSRQGQLDRAVPILERQAALALETNDLQIYSNALS